MISNPELQRLLSDQPLARLQVFASALGWNGLALCHHVIPDDEVVRLNLQCQVIMWYETTDPKFNLQINIHPHGQVRHHRAVVKAERYGISVTDWYDFELLDGDEEIRATAERLKPWLNRESFKNREWQKWFLQQWPERATILRRSKNRRGTPRA